MRLATFGAVVAAATSIWSTTASAGAVVDVDNILLAPPGTTGFSGIGAFSDIANVAGSTWTVGVSGRLAAIGLLGNTYWEESPGGFDLTLSVYRGYGGSQMGAEFLGSVVRPASEIADPDPFGHAEWNLATFDVSGLGIRAEVGEILTWEVSVPGCVDPCRRSWIQPLTFFPSGAEAPDYPGGTPFTASPNFGFVPTTGEANFRTTMAVPEPASWALMILGFGGVGAALRRRVRDVAFA